ncbi:hypothetical protein HDV03_004806 [Kappamyces sp. JEL0829]|nr:hypothetical protein HDV03_004806 [Kappamyces sp. JEL0829]
MLANEQKILAWAAGSRMATLAFALLAGWLADDYDTSTQTDSAWWRPLIRWDAVYFLDIAENGYKYEQQFAFFPGLPLLMRLLAALLDPLSYLSTRTSIVLAGILISNLCFVAAALALYRLGLALDFRPKTALAAAILFCISPASIFMSTLYTESLFAFLTLQGMRLYVEGRKSMACALWACSSLVRSNGTMYAGFFVWDIVDGVRRKRLGGQTLLAGLARAVVVVLPMGVFQWVGYWTFCRDQATARPWCLSLVPSIYAFVQQEYWNNGLLAYWTVANIPNFLLALPVYAMHCTAIFSYAAADPVRFATLGFGSSKPQHHEFHTTKLLPFVYLTVALMFYLTFFMHVQIIIRIFTCLPIVPLYAASVLNSHSSRPAHVTYYLAYLVAYSSIGIVLFAVFLPPA